MTRAQIEARIRGHVLHPGRWTRYWLALAWSRLFLHGGYGIPPWGDPLKAMRGKFTKGDAVIRTTNTMSLGFKQRIQILFGGSLVLRHSIVVIPEQFKPIGSMVDLGILPPGVFKSAAEVEKWDAQRK